MNFAKVKGSQGGAMTIQKDRIFEPNKVNFSSLYKLNTQLKHKKQVLLRKDNYFILLELIRAQRKTQGHNSFLGAFWSFLNPVLFAAMLFFVFNHRIGSTIPDYSIYVLIGTVVVNYFLESTSQLVGFFSSNRDFFIDLIIPKELFFVAASWNTLSKFIYVLGFCLVVISFKGLFHVPEVLILIPGLLLFSIFTSSVALILSVLNCLLTDVSYIWALVSRLIFFVTPVFFSLDMFNTTIAKSIYFLNPLTPFCQLFRCSLMGAPCSPIFLFHCLVLTIFFLFLGYGSFLILEDLALERA